jgi:hypothetical protein
MPWFLNPLVLYLKMFGSCLFLLLRCCLVGELWPVTCSQRNMFALLSVWFAYSVTDNTVTHYEPMKYTDTTHHLAQTVPLARLPCAVTKQTNYGFHYPEPLALCIDPICITVYGFVARSRHNYLFKLLFYSFVPI